MFRDQGPPPQDGKAGRVPYRRSVSDNYKVNTLYIVYTKLLAYLMAHPLPIDGKLPTKVLRQLYTNKLICMPVYVGGGAGMHVYIPVC